ncbi:hypothetical protein N9Z89_00825 [Akkermansiaceae bacterium]|nr:hypothetical protein [Akkermansiaceae bacterium]
MPIPAGTKFHGVAPSVDTTDKGSASRDALRDAYTIEEIGSAGTSDVYTLGSSTDGDNVDLNLNAVSGVDSTVQLTAGTGIGISQSGGNNVTIDNTLNNVGGVAILEPEFMTVGPGGSSTITTSKNLIDLNWFGGSGTHNLTLPSAADIPYRFLRIVNNGTVTAQDKVDVYAPGSETIDGQASYRINKVYNGIAVWSDGNKWIVIQAKST